MIFEDEQEIRDFSTVYKKEYGFKRLRKLFKATPFFTEYDESNPITDACKEYLNTEMKNRRLPFHKRTESPADYLEKVRSERPHLKMFLPQEPPEETLIEREKDKLLKSTYQLEFGKKLGGGNVSIDGKKSIDIVIPEDYSVPETIQRTSYRDPHHFSSNGLLQSKKFPAPPNNLVFDEKERERLKVRTGNSEYQDKIGQVGNRILKEQLYGPPLPIEPPEEHIKGPDSPRSMCSQILMNTSKNYVISQVI